MRIFLLAVLCAVALKGVVAEGENEVKRGSFPFMAYLYYPDETILENDARFTRSAALISNDWLISSGDVAGVAFPQKTLLARLGAINIDKNMTLNEDEDEQEREIILILRPYNYTTTEWWKTDISLLKTLLPFNVTSFVASATLVSNPDTSQKNCYILVYASRDNVTERTLTQMNVKLLPPTQKECGNHFVKESMACASELDKEAVTNPNFCQGNKGGPLVCDDKLTGLQTYVSGCEQPYLYQLVTAWKKLITCAAEERYSTQSCANVSIAIAKDPPPSDSMGLSEINDEFIIDKITTHTQNDDEILTDKTNTQSVYSESVNSQVVTDVTEYTTLKEAGPTLTSVTESESLETKMNDRNEEHIITINASAIIENYSYNTSTNEVTYYTKEETVLDSTEERDRKNHIEAQHQLVNGDALLNIPTLFYYLMTFVFVLSYT